ncbi:type II secretion system F family protein [Pseudidiomarina donghaiensis]|uniref:Type II secretion system F family protein n=1 Tax=Pseudidiomarina donghaiensis TaxID=519452 RepID=A0A432XKB6_9GAMM|nr:type II secretion system F family protein [Pseudidiomarina donghaiensis]RUO49189.1 type II secretion system F family protein [Pseudidiomarina donghaiensis]SFV20733.1 type IV pilus assembly protein PilC [Pseudidiomarina donghaiensis]
MAKKPQAVKEITEFAWTGINKRGQKVKGLMRADNDRAVRARLRDQGVMPKSVKKKAKSLFGNKKITGGDIALFTRQIATMLSAGVPLLQSLEMVAKGVENPKIRDLMLTIANDVGAGSPLASALRKHPTIFDTLYCDLVDSGEQSGSLETIFDRIATYREKSEALKAKIKKALVYPASVIVVALVVTVILLVFVVPQFEAVFKDFGAELPAMTQFVVTLSEIVQAYFLYVAAGLIVAGWLFKRAYGKSQNLRDKVDAISLKVPVIKEILNKAAVARFARTLSTTFAAGVPLINALESAAGASGNAVYRDAIFRIRDEVTSGMQMNTAMQSQDLFPTLAEQMVFIGEESGSLDDMLAKVASIYEREVDDLVDNLTALLEPMIMVVIGVLVGGLIVAMYLPIFSLGQVVG